MASLKQNVTHRRTSTVCLKSYEVRRILTKAACELAGVDLDTVEIKLNVERETEGSPSYPVDKWRATVTITERFNDEAEGPDRKVDIS